jgi:antitoxin (DNA-binding transcriptional repressor) of toxin-antitoxin stability system
MGRVKRATEPTEIGVFHAKTHLSGLLQQVEQGSVFFISRRGQRIAELRPVAAAKKPLKLGWAKNDRFWMAKDFDAPLRDFAEYM